MQKYIPTMLTFFCLWMPTSHGLTFLPESTPIQNFQQAEAAQRAQQEQNNTQNKVNTLSTATNNTIATQTSATVPAPETSAALLAQAVAESTAAHQPTSQTGITQSNTLNSPGNSIHPPPFSQLSQPKETASNQNVAATPNLSNLSSNYNSQISEVSVKLEALSTEVDQLNQQMLLFQQQNSGRFANVANKNSILRNKVEQLTLQVQILNQKINTIVNQKNISEIKIGNQSTESVQSSATAPTQTTHSLNFFDRMKQWLYNNIYYLVVSVGLIGLLIIFISMLFQDNGRKKNN